MEEEFSINIEIEVDDVGDEEDVYPLTNKDIQKIPTVDGPNFGTYLYSGVRLNFIKNPTNFRDEEEICLTINNPKENCSFYTPVVSMKIDDTFTLFPRKRLRP